MSVAWTVAEVMECVTMIDFMNVCESYTGKRALENVSLSLPGGEFVGLFGV